METLKPAEKPWIARATLRAWFIGLLSLTAVAPLAAQEFVAGAMRSAVVEDRQLLVLASAPDAAAASPLSGGFAAQSFETASHRIHVVTVDGETYRAATPLAGPRSHIAFDPARRRFVSLLPSIRVEHNGSAAMEAAAVAVGATGITLFASAGFAILDLPSDLHPADALAILDDLPGVPAASLRLRPPRIRWR